MADAPKPREQTTDDTTQIIRKQDLEDVRRMSERIPSLIVLQGSDAGRVFKLTNSAMSVGRGSSAHLRLNDKAISRKHCLVEISPNYATLIDLQSSNGTFVNGEKVTKKKLADGDKIQVGNTILKFEIADTADREFHEQYYQLITFDDLTSLYNRKHLFKTLDMMFRSARNRFPFSVVFMDLDHFKLVNDTHDHLTGSAVLSEVGRILLSNLRTTDTPCRYGGEEFVLILNDTTAMQAVIVAEKVRKLIEEHEFHTRTGNPLQVTASLGIAEVAADCATPADLIARADEAMYKAKEWGRNRTVLYRGEGDPRFVLATPTEMDEHTPHTG